ncbi:MAG TPA: PA domain-containing protein, partial [Vicinamibacterales bacterium]|nr:PA domain-containing protein [Vicinamibacterales bacterium]
MKNIRLVLFASLLLIAPSLFAGANIVIVNLDGPNEGFNDPTPAAPVGGNPGTTVGQQRLIAFQHAASIWGALLDSSVQIRIQAAFNPLTCTATSAVLGSAGAITVSRDFPGAEWSGTWYSAALANKRSGIDRVPAQNDLNAQFNSSLGGTNPNGTPCFTGGGWYYGLDGNRGNKTDLIIVLLHEFAHGLGFQTFMNAQAGTLFSGFPDTYNRHLADLTRGGALWPSLTNAQRAASALNQYNVVWTGAEVTAQSPSFLRNAPVLRIDSPASLGTKVGQDATFGPPLNTFGTSGVVVEAIDALEPVAGATTKDGCSPITSNVAGKIALMDRGVCTFNVKVKNAQDAGAIGAIIVNNVASGLPGMGGVDNTITIPS